MSSEASNNHAISGLLVFAAIVLAAYGLTSNLPFLGGAFLCAGLLLARQPGRKRMGIATSVFGLLYFVAVFGYGVGKDMAERDNARHAGEAAVVPGAP